MDAPFWSEKKARSEPARRVKKKEVLYKEAEKKNLGAVNTNFGRTRSAFRSKKKKTGRPPKITFESGTKQGGRLGREQPKEFGTRRT